MDSPFYYLFIYLSQSQTVNSERGLQIKQLIRELIEDGKGQGGVSDCSEEREFLEDEVDKMMKVYEMTGNKDEKLEIIEKSMNSIPASLMPI